MKNFFQIIFFPFELLGDIFVQVWKLIRIFWSRFFYSVWSIIIPLAIMLSLTMAFFIAQNQRELAADYSKQLMSCEDDEINRLVLILQNLDVAGLIELVKCLQSDREKVFFASYDAIINEIQKLPNSNDEKKRDKIYLTLTDTILQQTPNFKPIAKNASHQFVRQIMTDLINLKSNGRSRDLQLATLNCEKIQAIIEPTLQQGKNQNGELQKPSSKSIAKRNVNSFKEELLAADGTPFKQIIQNDKTSPTITLDDNELLADYNPPKKLSEPNRQNYPADTNNSFPILPKLDYPNNKITSQYNPPNEKITTQNPTKQLSTPPNYDENYYSPFQNYQSESSGTLTGITSADANYFLPDELRKINLNRIPSLSTPQLMRLLQHPESNYVLEARQTLIARDGFGEKHLNLAYKLYHHSPAVRKEIISHLSETHGVLVNTWLAELLNDPNDEIRYNAAARLSTSKDPNTRKLLIEKCQHDADLRIVNLINQLKQR
ncbi:MAG: HEAT repeat domain-containing protein [Planctomycetaceae bacterium]|jgi:hypothetical protein|nr:HEAT repeat domain-containing protein [Planctomycetaceae bacterium]